ncbi:Protein CBG26975 [Caenorhabditis briggsae]|uniref:Protein CBG26975 n=1 Tax=Caenorhabditis briggsae TaxID=6238 RepID=B6IEU1_CAEBR|nr:Protein CBG26975 [Caenorhabditis briggsae]CAR98421.1 Protein CBG26975 [Caenorhabditis briggsae]
MPPALHISGLCEVCDQPAFGKHFGVLSCRACAAFFRRSGNWLKQKKCDKENCKIFEESYKCKICEILHNTKVVREKDKKEHENQ